MKPKYLLSPMVFVVGFVFCCFAYAGSPLDLVLRTSGYVASPVPQVCEALGVLSEQSCMNNPKIKKLGCSSLRPPSEFLGGLKPYLPLQVCVNIGKSSSGESVTDVGCSSAVRERYIVVPSMSGKEDPKLINSKEEFRNFFAPIEDGKEAVSYLAALTTSYPIYKFPKKFSIRGMDGEYTSKDLKPTEIDEGDKGYLVRLFSEPMCGCHTPELYEVTYFVSKDGQITKKDEKKVWQASGGRIVCAD